MVSGHRRTLRSVLRTLFRSVGLKGFSFPLDTVVERTGDGAVGHEVS